MRRLSLIVVLVFIGIVVYTQISDKPISDLRSVASNKVEIVASGSADSDALGGDSSADANKAADNSTVATRVATENQPPQKIEISGIVIDENDDPIEDALVSDESQFGSARTDAEGRYHITVEKPKFKTPFLNFLRTGYRENRVGVPMEEVSAESTLNLNVRLQSASNSTTVHGWVGNELGVGLSGHKIRLRTRSFDRAESIFYAVISDHNGDFTFEGIRSDLEYRLDIASTEEYAGFNLEPYLVSQNTPRTVIVLDRLKLVNIDGMIVDTDNAPVANFEINLVNLSVDYPNRKISSDSTGFFKLEGFPAGKVKLSTNAPEFFRISGLTLHENDYRNLTLAIDMGSYHLSGWVRDEHGGPMAKARVTLNSIFTRTEYQSYSYRSTLTDGNGGFQFSRLGRQDHTISVYAKGFNTQIQQHRFASFSDTIEIELRQATQP